MEYRLVDVTKLSKELRASDGECLNHLARRLFVEMGDTGLYRIYVNTINQYIKNQRQDNVHCMSIGYFNCKEINATLVTINIYYNNETICEYFAFGDYVFPEKDLGLLFDNSYDIVHKLKFIPELNVYMMGYRDIDDDSRCFLFKDGRIVDLLHIGDDE